jgi:ATP-dependent helicase HrpB
MADLDEDSAGILVAAAFPGLIARRRPGDEPLFLLSCGRGARLAKSDPLAREEFLAVAATDGRPQGARIFLAAPVGAGEIERLHGGRTVEEEVVEWDARRRAVECCRRIKLGAVVLREGPLPAPDPEAVLAALLQGLASEGLHALNWTRESVSLRMRLAFLRSLDGESSDWPDLSDEALLGHPEQWLGPFATGMRKLSELACIDLCAAFRSLLAHDLLVRLDREAPTHLTVPSGSRIRLDYAEGVPVLPVKIQEMFGQCRTPAVAGGRAPVLLHLLSPAGRPVQVTRDLESFWRDTYHHVRKELRGRYPKHPWPEDPAGAEPTRKTKRQTARQ